jgi:hypothetical protein
VDDLKSSHTDSRVNDELDKWLQENYGEHGEVTIHRGKTHGYLGMQLDYSVKGKVKVGMIEYDSEIKKTKLQQRLQAMPYSMRDKGGNYTKNVWICTTQWWQKPYSYASVQDQTYSRRLLYYAQELRNLAKLIGTS